VLAFRGSSGILEGKELLTGGIAMLLEKSWFTLDEAESKFGVEKAQIMEWIEEGVVRCEMEKDVVARVNADDLELMMKEQVPL